MSLQASGRVVRDRGGLEVIVERRLPVGAPEAWRWLTVASRAKRWTSATLVALEPGERVEVVGDGWGAILSLAPLDHGCIVYAKERVETSRDAAAAGPRWEHALDRLVAAVTGGDAPPGLDRYLATLRPAYERLAMDGDPVPWPPS
jgi:hypothetical protein